MIKLKDYINEQLNESLLAIALVGAICTHFAVKGLKKVRKCSDDFWGWATGEKNLSVSTTSESLTDNKNQLIKEKKFDKTKAQPAQIEKEDILKKIIEKTEPESSEKSKKGFYVFQNLLKEDPKFLKINKAPYFPNYVVFMDAGSKDNEDERPNFYGMLGFSVKYWEQVFKKGKDEKIKKAAKDYVDYLHVFAVQTDPKFAKAGLFDVYLETLKDAVKQMKLTGITIKYDNDKLAEVFAKYGFKKIDDLENIMVLDINKKKEDTL